MRESLILQVRVSMLKLCRWAALPITSADVKANCEDLKVLGKGDFKTLIKWRTALREEVRSHAHLYNCELTTCRSA